MTAAVSKALPTYLLQYKSPEQTAGIIHHHPCRCDPSAYNGTHFHHFPHVAGVDLIRDGATLCLDCFPHMLDFQRASELDAGTPSESAKE